MILIQITSYTIGIASLIGLVYGTIGAARVALGYKA